MCTANKLSFFPHCYAIVVAVGVICWLALVHMNGTHTHSHTQRVFELTLNFDLCKIHENPFIEDEAKSANT